MLYKQIQSGTLVSFLRFSSILEAQWDSLSEVKESQNRIVLADKEALGTVET